MTEIQEYRKNVEVILGDKKAFNDLANHTFSAIKDRNLIPQALIKGQMMGFTIENFMIGDAYAVQYAGSFNILTSIGYARKVAMRSGQTGKSKPIFVRQENGKFESCEVTIYKKDGHEHGYTALVFFDEYNTGKQQWASKPGTMIAKVAEMHALRMAFPEQMSEMYSEEEMGTIDITPREDMLAEHRTAIDAITDTEALKEYHEEHAGLGKEFDALIIAKNKELLDSEKQDEDIS